MYTQCPHCETIFRLSAEALRAASGQVRCGRCGEAFSALARLAERPDAFTIGESPLELESRADRILGSTAAADEAQAEVEAEFADGDVQGDTPVDEPESSGRIAHLEIIGPPIPPEEGSLEFTLPPGELDRIFVAPEPADGWPPPPSASIATAAEAGTQAATDEPTVEAAHRAPPPAELIAAAPKRRWATVALVLAAVALALLLGAQLINRNREYLAEHTPFGGALRAVYARLGFELPVPADLADYQLRQWGATGDPAANGILRVRASILNAAAAFQPYPLLRLTLTDRFDRRVGSRDFAPREYLGRPAELMAPGQRTDVTIQIVDPGKDAVGFEIDVCLRGADGGVFCGSGAAPHAG
ncbi:MAG TPA: DUF3426 domain-containing protein [Steroidobacteraceae bacterium]|nr:DUF3426 domain-containing protein [Steroidobacteraceae bacterium]